MLKYILSAIIVIILIVVNVLKNKISKDILLIVRTVLVILLLETTIFNINSYRVDLGNLKHINFSEGEISEMTNLTPENTQYISIENINFLLEKNYCQTIYTCKLPPSN